MRKVILTVAPIDYTRVESFPTAEELAQDICDCCAAGASVVHFHVTDEQGKPCTSIAFFEKTVSLIRDQCDIIIQGSTGGVGLSLEERSVALDVEGVEMASLNMGSCNIGNEAYINAPEEIFYWAEKMKRNKIVPDMAVFEPGMFEMVNRLIEKHLIRDPYCFSFPVGFPNALPATPENLLFLSQKMPAHASWSLVAHHSADFQMHAAAIAMGGGIRVGFEDSDSLTSDQKASCNTELVTKARYLVLELGQEVATPKDTRIIYGIQ